MYESLYGFTEKPFSLLPDPDFLYLSGRHRKALNMLEFAVLGQAGFTLITGEVGTGKTLLIKHFLRKIGDQANIGLIENTHQEFGSLMDWMLSAFNLDSEARKKASRFKQFVDYLKSENAAGKKTFLIVDEAQNLSMKALEELRIFSNINLGKKPILQVFLSGQPELLKKLNRPELRQFAQRISVSYQLAPFSLAETRDYIRHRLTRAGGKANIFDDEACAAAYRLSQGVPRMINLVCDAALVFGFGEGLTRIGLQSMLDVLDTMQAGGLNNLPGGSDGLDREKLIAEINGMTNQLRAVASR